MNDPALSNDLIVFSDLMGRISTVVADECDATQPPLCQCGVCGYEVSLLFNPVL
jgi:hypothetical protein